MAPKPPKKGLVRAASRPPTLLSADEQQLSDQAVTTFLKVVGGRDALTEVLAVATTTTELQPVVQLLLDPRYDTVPLQRLCRMAGLTAADLFVAYRKALIARAHIQATVTIAEKLTAVVDDVMRRAAPHTVPCGSCAGTGALPPRPTKLDPNPAPAPCPTCRATGRLAQLPDLDRQKLALELAQLTQRSGGIFVQQNNVAPDRPTGLQTPGALEQLQQAVSQVLYAGPITLQEETEEKERRAPLDPDEDDEPPEEGEVVAEPDEEPEPEPAGPPEDVA